MEELEKRLIMLVEKILQLENISIHTRRTDTEQWDSLAHVMLISEIEAEFHISIPFEDIANIEKVSDFIKYIR